MLRLLLSRPIAVTMVLITASIISVIAFLHLPISLLPDIDVPEITIAVRAPDASPEEIEQNILKPIRENMLTINGLRTIESIARQENGSIYLKLDYGIDMSLVYIEVNEKVDRLMSGLPKGLDRPHIIKSNTSDIPIARIQVVPVRPEDHVSVSDLTVNTLRRRLEQLDGIGLVDVNGSQQEVIRIAPKYEMLRSLKLAEGDLTRAIQSANLELGSLSVRDGNYRYFLKMESRANTAEDIEELLIQVPGTNSLVKVSDVASVYKEPERKLGHHLFNSEEGLVITVHKQPQARMTEVMPTIYKTVSHFRDEYPEAKFEITQDQSALLTLSIQNLSQALIWGGLFAFIVLFLFMKGWREPLVMGIVLPLSLILCFSLLYLFKISLNVISLSGLALGLGMLVDNSIVVIDNIVLKRKAGIDLIDSCVLATHEVMPPLISSALTNLAVFVPLIFLSGITGALFFDQAISVVAILSVSVLCTFLFVPLFYSLVYKNKPYSNQQDSKFFLWMKAGYHRSFNFVWNHKIKFLTIMSFLIPLSFVIFLLLPREGFPELERTEAIITIDWNEPIGLSESLKRVKGILSKHQQAIQASESEVGLQQFILSSSENSNQHVSIYMKFKTGELKDSSQLAIKNYLTRNFPVAHILFNNAPNAFEQLFISHDPEFEVRLRDLKSKKPIPIADARRMLETEQKTYTSVGKGFESESMAIVKIDFLKLKTYKIDFQQVTDKLRILFGEYRITEYKSYGETIPIVFEGSRKDFETAIRSAEVVSVEGDNYPLKGFVSFSYQESYENITADQAGIFQSVSIDPITDKQASEAHWLQVARESNLSVNFTGKWFEDKKNLERLLFILAVAFVIMYLIITAEFESLTLPIIVIVSIPIGITGSLLCLWVFGGTINIMSAIGLVVVLGILDNDAILKIDRINTLRNSMPLEQAIRQAGLDRLKPIVMNTCTNVLALVPILFSSGLGADLQRPVAITTIGGLILATLAALYFVPSLYWVLYKGKPS